MAVGVLLKTKGRTDTYLTYSSNFDFMIIDDEDFFLFQILFKLQLYLQSISHHPSHQPSPIIQHSTFTGTLFSTELKSTKSSHNIL